MTMANTSRIGRLLIASVLLAVALTPILPLTARGCSCAMPSDLHEWVDQYEAVFVGTLVEKRDGGNGQFGMESIYVFEVEEWIKGDAGDVIEVHSASDGAGCGFEFWDADQRTGAAIRLEDGVLRGDLCSQIDADVALTLKTGMVPSRTGVGHLLVGHGWSSPGLTVLDDAGGHVADLASPAGFPEGVGTQDIDVCPGGELMVQAVPPQVVVWRLDTLVTVATHDVSGLEPTGWVEDISCRDPEASSIYLLLGDDISSVLVDVPAMIAVLELEGSAGRIGTDYLLSQHGPEGDISWVDLATGASTPIAAVPPGELWSLTAAPHPTERRAALMETRFDEANTSSSLTVVDETGAPSFSLDLSLEAYAPTWLDDTRLLITGYDWEVSEIPSGLVIDTANGEVVELGPWNSIHNVAIGELVYGVDAGSVLRADLTTGSVETLVTMPVLNAGPLLLLDAAEPIEVVTTTAPTTGPTVPPLVAAGTGSVPGAESGSSLDARWIAGGTVLVFLGLLTWLAISSPRRPSDSP